MDAFVGEIRAFAFNYCPQDWLPCNGSQVQIQQYQALAAVIGTRYGGNGTTTIGLPNLQSRAVINTITNTSRMNPIVTTMYSSFLTNNQQGGQEGIALSYSQVPNHIHNAMGVARTASTQTSAVVNTPGNTVYLTSAYDKGDSGGVVAYANALNQPGTLNPGTVGAAGGNATGAASPHENRMPFLAMQFCICAYGEFPPRQ